MDVTQTCILKAISLSKPGGIIVNILPSNFLFSERYKNFRSFLKNSYQVLGIIQLSNEVFINSKTETSILILKNNSKKLNNLVLADLNKDFNNNKDELLNTWNDFLKEELSNVSN